MRFFDSLFGYSARRPGPTRKYRRLRLEALENRTVPAASGVLSGTTLTITGGGGGFDELDLTLNASTNQLVLLEFNQIVGVFDNAAVQQITINATALNNDITIDQSVLQAATIQGGPDSNILQAGAGSTLLIAGPGTNRLMGGPGNDTINAMQGVNVIAAGTGNNIILSGVSGQNTIIGNSNNDTILNSDPTVDHVYEGDAPPYDSQTLGLTPSPDATLTTADVNALLDRAAAATPGDDAIVAVVDRGGRILGVRVEGNVSSAITSNTDTEVFAIDGAVAEARTGALFANNTAPLTSRTIQFISQTTITQREVESNPSIQDPNSPLAGPGFVAPIGVQGNFPPGVTDTPQVDLFDIEATNRDTTLHPGVDGMSDAVALPERFNVNPAYVPASITDAGDPLAPMDSYGYDSGLEVDAEPRGIGTLPGGVPIYANVNGQPVLVGGIGVFYPGTTGYADAENSSLSSNYNPNLPDLSLQAEYTAFAAVGGAPGLGLGVGSLGGVSLPSDLFNGEPIAPGDQINLNGITLPLFGPDDGNGPQELLQYGESLPAGNPNSGFNAPLLQPVGGVVNPGSDTLAAGNVLPGTLVPEGWLVLPHAGTDITAAQVEQTIEQGVAQAEATRAQIRLPLNTAASMVFAVTDPTTGEVLGLFRMPDATVFSIDVAVAKARNVGYYDNASQLQPEDETDGAAPGDAFTNETFRFLALPFYPEGQNGEPPGQFSILNDGGSSLTTGLNTGAPLPASAFTSVMGHDAFNPETNFHDPYNILNQNGVVFFPGSSPLYTSDGTLIGGFGASGDGVAEDDFITFGAVQGFTPPSNITTADEVFSRGVRLPYIEFDRQPLLPTAS
jgi:uncharacterized protein GlcG (DUF336 family)